MTKLLSTTSYNFDNNYINNDSRKWSSNKTPKSVTKIDRELTEYFYHCMRNIDFPMRVNYCWNFSESHRNFFNQTYNNKNYCIVNCGKCKCPSKRDSISPKQNVSMVTTETDTHSSNCSSTKTGVFQNRKRSDADEHKKTNINKNLSSISLSVCLENDENKNTKVEVTPKNCIAKDLVRYTLKNFKFNENNDEAYNFVEYIEFIDQQLNIKKTKTRLIQNNENIFDLIKSWNKIKLESKIQDVKTKLILSKKSPSTQIENNNPKLKSPSIKQHRLISSETNKSNKKLVRQKSFDDEPLEQFNAISSIEINNNVVSSEIYSNNNKNDEIISSTANNYTQSKKECMYTNINNKNEDDDVDNDEDDEIDTIDDNNLISISSKLSSQKQQDFKLNNLNKQSLARQQKNNNKKKTTTTTNYQNGKSALKRLLKL